MSHLVLVPTDFSDVCENALSHGAEYVKKFKGKLLILHVINKETRTFLTRIKKGSEHIDLKLKELSDGIQKKFGVEVECLAREGSIFKVISQVGLEQGAAMMVLGTHGKYGLQHVVGSAAMRVMSGFDTPVVVVQKRIFGEGLKRIVLPLSLDIDFMEKLDWVVDLAGLFHSEVLIYLKGNSVNKMPAAMGNIKRLIESKLHLENIPFQVHISDKRENFSKDLIDFAIINRADMIIASMEKNKFETLPMSGTEEETLIYNSSQIPVMCINTSS